MSCMSPERRAEIQARIVKKKTQLTKLEAAMDEITEIESYKFDSGEANQQTKYRKIENIQKAIDRLEAQIDFLNRKLSGKSNANMNLRRKNF